MSREVHQWWESKVIYYHPREIVLSKWYRLFTKAKNCLAEEHVNVAITKGERSCYSVDRVSKRYENRETRQLIDRNNN